MSRGSLGGMDAGSLMVLDPSRGSARVDIVSGSFGAGHDAAARELGLRLVAQGHRVRMLDVVDLFPARIGPFLRAAYLRQLAVSPRSWGLLLRLITPGTLLHRMVTRAVALPARRLLALVADGADLVISTHPFASQTLGRLRSRRQLAVPVVTYLTDASVHALWVHPSVDLHLALHEVAARQARSLGGVTTVVEPLVPAVYAEGRGRVLGPRDRSLLGLPGHEPLALIVGGSLGIGELEQAARDVAATGLARPIVLCGHNDALARRLGTVPGVIAFGWRDDLPDLIRAVDCVVQNAGGFTSLEALAAGVPVLTYRCLPGHGQTNAAALEEAGLVPWARDRADLSRVLGAALAPAREKVACSGALPTVVDALTHSLHAVRV